MSGKVSRRRSCNIDISIICEKCDINQQPTILTNEASPEEDKRINENNILTRRREMKSQRITRVIPIDPEGNVNEHLMTIHPIVVEIVQSGDTFGPTNITIHRTKPLAG